jgi:hypothetical protein
LSVPRAELSPLATASREELLKVYSGNSGATISQDDLDVDIFVPGLLDRLFGRTIRAELGRRSGLHPHQQRRRLRVKTATKVEGRGR